MAAYVQSAIRRGLHTIIFLEHLETGIHTSRRTWLSRHDFETYFATGNHLQRQYGGRIRIVLGVEIGWNPHAADELQQLVHSFPWQWRGLSYHFYCDGDRHLNMVSHKRRELDRLAEIGSEHILSHYFQQLIQAHRLLDCQVICHLDAVLRHLPNVSITTEHLQQIDKLFAAMARKGTRLELNTAGIAMRGMPFPGPKIIHMARDHGLSLLPGSDAHHPDQVGRFFHQLPAWIEQA